MSNSSLISYTRISPNKTSPRNHKIDTITIHCMAGNLSVESCGELFAEGGLKASSNYGVGTDGRIALYVDEGDRSWCSSNDANDNRAVTIEVANDGGAEIGWHVSDQAFHALIDLVTDICMRNGIKKLLWKDDKSLIGQVDKQNMTIHRWFAAKDCPGEYLLNLHSEIAAQVNQRMRETDPGEKRIYLTFDDGPGPYTQKLLDILDRYHVKVTFFTTNRMPEYTYLIGEEKRRGHTVAAHSYTHDYAKIYESVDAYFEDLEKMNDLIRKQTGKESRLIRFPGGTSNTVSREYCTGIMSRLSKEVTERGFRYVDWNIDVGDSCDTTDTSEIVSKVISDIKRMTDTNQCCVPTVLLHDVKGYTVDGVEEILKWGLDNGYKFLPLTENSPLVHHPAAN